MTVVLDEKLIEAILKSPSATVWIDRIQSILEAEKEKRLAFYNQVTEQEKAEFINGEIIVHSPVKKEHNEISINLVKIIGTYVLEKELGFVGMEKILIQCTRNDYEPDLCFFNKSKSDSFKKDQSLFPIPDLIIEILSSGTEKRERGIKYEDYQNHGVKEYWIIDPNKKTVEQYLLNDNDVYELNVKINSGNIDVREIEGLSIPVAAIFDGKKAHQFVKKIYLGFE